MSKHDTVIAELTDKFSQFVVEDDSTIKTADPAILVGQATFNSWKQSANRATADLWHQRLGHPGPEVISMLMEASEGVRVRGPSMVECEACGISKIHRQVRRQPRKINPKAGKRWAVDFLELTRDDEEYKKVMLFTDRYSGYVFDIYLTDWKTQDLLQAFDYFFRVLDYQFGIKPTVIESDNEIVQSTELKEHLEHTHLLMIEHSAPNTPAQNGGAERSGGVIK